MEDEEKWWNRIMAVICFFIMIGIATFAIYKNQNEEKEIVPSPSPTVETTTESVK